MDDPLARAAELIATNPPAVVFTGAGVSTESGIPDFRSRDGVWARYDPDDFSWEGFLGSMDKRRRYWELGRELYPTVRQAEPNPAHHAIVRLDRLGLLDCVITQNIDNLHQRAGTPPEKVIELHGNSTRARCLDCGEAYTRDELQVRLEAGEAVPDCRTCGGIIKPHTILFGEPMPPAETRLAEERARRARTFLVVGSSLVVYPAADMPVYAKQSGAHLVIINLTPTPLDALADVVIAGRAGAVMEQLAARVSERARA